jgi:hypothetical protein
MNVNYTYTPRVFGDTIEITIKNNEAVIGVKLFGIPSYTIESAISELKFEGENFGFFIDGTSYPPQKDNVTETPPPDAVGETPSQDTSTTGGVSFDISRITLTEEPDVTNIATSQINQTLNTQELETTKKLLLLALPFEVKLISILNAKKEEIQSKLIPFIVRQLTPFGATVVQFIINNPAFYKTRVNPQEVAPLLDELKEYISCPNERVVTQLINKRNKTATQINNLYQNVKTINKTTDSTNSVITTVQTGITTIQAIPYPAIGIPPLGLPPLTTGVIETIGATADVLRERLNINKVVLSDLNITAASFGSLLGSSLNLLNILDLLIQQCSENQGIPFTQINNEINLLNNQSQEIEQTQNNLTYKGFKLELQLDKTNQIKYPRRFAQALNKQGVPVLKTESSFASDPKVLIDQLKFIIDLNPNLTAE